MNIDAKVMANADVIDDLEVKAKANSDAIGMTSESIGALGTQIMGLDSTVMQNMMSLTDLQGKAAANKDGVEMNSDEVKRL